MCLLNTQYGSIKGMTHAAAMEWVQFGLAIVLGIVCGALGIAETISDFRAYRKGRGLVLQDEVVEPGLSCDFPPG